jgi:16S rRNA (guanine527-N7)-methyltransferase
MELTAAEQAHLSLLEVWRRGMDLIGPGPALPHFEDAIGAVSGLPVAGTWADLGSGAGFPGVAMAARFPEATVWLVESRQKRAAFLEQVVAAAGLRRAAVRCVRSETLADGCLDGVIARAYRPPPLYLQDAARLLRPGGLAVVMLGDDPSMPDWPPGWQEDAALSRRYPVGDGWRRRVVLRRSG